MNFQKKILKNCIYIQKKKRLKFISTPFDFESAKFLSKIVDAFKISSGDNNFFDLIKYCASFKKPLIISTGMLNLNEIKDILLCLDKIKFPRKKLAFLHCVSDYPAKDIEANLFSIKYLKDKLSVTIGYSDHVIGSESCIIAKSLGAKIIEKHFTLNNNFSNFRDHQIALNPEDMQKMTSSIRRVEKMLGNYGKNITRSERKNYATTRRSIYFSRNLKKGAVLKRDDLKIVRPHKINNPKDLSKILGKQLRKDVRESDLITLKILKQ